MRKLFVLYDPDCGLCEAIRGWMLDQRSSLQIEIIASGSARSRLLFPAIESEPDELVVVDDDGTVYRGDSAFIICLYALDAYRAWAYRLSSPILRPFARRAFEMLSKNRKKISDLLALANDEVIAHELDRGSHPDGCEVPVW
jgi:predicted DCC family thiol-disulfide oxidoreductase YuxK